MHNHLPIREMRMSPAKKFTETVFSDYNHLIRAHTCGCPVYVLDPRLQDSKKIPKWKMRSRRGIYLGISKHHSSTVHLVLNPETGAISPQYHCIFADTFSTVWSDGIFDYIVWECLVETVDRHHSVEPNENGDVILPPDFSPFTEDINETTIHHENQQRIPTFPRQNNNNNTIKNPNHSINKEVEQKDPTITNEMPLLSRNIFNPPSSLSPLPPISHINSPVQEQPRRSTRSNFGNAPKKLDPSNHHITNYTSALPNTTPSEHYCNASYLVLHKVEPLAKVAYYERSIQVNDRT
jgi:hypothetical protein